ncbi:hypothetical protein AB0I81_52485 [Nonomuraea sp. NPDC050404]|uniref:hypothetical protein n=1 Tax=Nonomuraea sp. NPDC050404 TaxID=3155783 RepID=UPI0033D900E3
MVNENFGSDPSRLPLRQRESGRQPRPNPAAGSLRQGDIVKPNYGKAQDRDDHPPGKILGIDRGEALVRWRDEPTTPQKYELKLLIKFEE